MLELTPLLLASLRRGLPDLRRREPAFHPGSRDQTPSGGGPGGSCRRSGPSCSGTKFIRLPPDFGYDAKFHIEYIRYIVDHHTLPLASDGFSMYHPPLFYGLAAGLVAAVEPTRGALTEQVVLKLIPFLCGLGMVWATYALMRRVFPRDPLPTFFAVVFAGTLPGQSLHVGLRLQRAPLRTAHGRGVAGGGAPPARPREGRSAGSRRSPVVLGLALMTKYTALITVPVIALLPGLRASARWTEPSAAPRGGDLGKRAGRSDR